MEATGNTDMAVALEVSVPAVLLRRVLRRQEGDLENLIGQAWEMGRPTPGSLKQALHDVRMLMERI